MERGWLPIEGFPDYVISNFGEIVNETTGTVIRQSRNQDGVVKVGLYKDGLQHTRSVRVLVAEAFVPGRTKKFNTPIHLDDDQENNRADNLTWRPRNFAWHYKRQFIDIEEKEFRGPIRDVETRDRYLHIYEAATFNGLLFADVWRSINHIRHFELTFPTDQRFEFV